MGTPYPPNQPKKLERSRSNRFLGGVCGGVATYLNMDPTLVRVLTVLISLFTGVPIILYIIALFVIPEEQPSAGPQSYPPVNAGQDTGPSYYSQPTWHDGNASGQPSDPTNAAAPGAAPRYGSGPMPSPGEEAIWGPEGAPWEQRKSGPPASAQPSAPATSAPEDPKHWQPEPGTEPAAPSTPAPEAAQAPPAPEQTSTWESAAAEPAPTTPDSEEPTDKQA
jgi:phage shock protein C